MNGAEENPDISSAEEEAQLIELERKLEAERERLTRTVNLDKEGKTAEV